MEKRIMTEENYMTPADWNKLDIPDNEWEGLCPWLGEESIKDKKIRELEAKVKELSKQLDYLLEELHPIEGQVEEIHGLPPCLPSGYKPGSLPVPAEEDDDLPF